MTEQEVIDLMSSSRNEDEWNKNCDEVKSKFNGDYPSFWYYSIILSGVLNRTRAGWSN